MHEFLEMLAKAATAMGIAQGTLVVEDDVILEKETLSTIAELDEFHRQNAIEKALMTGNREAFMQLTSKK